MSSSGAIFEIKDAYLKVHQIRAQVAKLDKDDSTRPAFENLLELICKFLFSFLENAYIDHRSDALDDALPQFWLRYEFRVYRLLIDLDGIAERRVQTTRLQKRFGASTKNVLADLAHLDTVFGDLSVISKTTLSSLVLKEHLHGHAVHAL